MSNFSTNGNYTYEMDYTPLNNNAYAGFGLFTRDNGNSILRFAVGTQGRATHNSGQVYADGLVIADWFTVTRDTSVGLNITVGTSYHLKLRTLNNTHFEFSINGLDQLSADDPSLATAAWHIIFDWRLMILSWKICK